MNTASPSALIEAARLLKQSSWSYEYNHPEKVSEAYMSDTITALELNMNSIPEDLLAVAIVTEIEKWGAQEEVASKSAKELAEFVADGVAHGLMGQLPYETVTFKIA